MTNRLDVVTAGLSWSCANTNALLDMALRSAAGMNNGELAGLGIAELHLFNGQKATERAFCGHAVAVLASMAHQLKTMGLHQLQGFSKGVMPVMKMVGTGRMGQPFLAGCREDQISPRFQRATQRGKKASTIGNMLDRCKEIAAAPAGGVSGGNGVSRAIKTQHEPSLTQQPWAITDSTEGIESIGVDRQLLISPLIAKAVIP